MQVLQQIQLITQIYYKQKHYDKALRAYKNAIQYDKRYYRSYYNQGLLYSLLENYEKSKGASNLRNIFLTASPFLIT